MKAAISDANRPCHVPIVVVGPWGNGIQDWGGVPDIFLLLSSKNRLIRRVRLNCVPAASSSIFGDVPDLSVEWAINNATDKREWTRNKPSCRSSLIGNKVTCTTTTTMFVGGWSGYATKPDLRPGIQCLKSFKQLVLMHP